VTLDTTGALCYITSPDGPLPVRGGTFVGRLDSVLAAQVSVSGLSNFFGIHAIYMLVRKALRRASAGTDQSFARGEFPQTSET